MKTKAHSWLVGGTATTKSLISPSWAWITAPKYSSKFPIDSSYRDYLLCHWKWVSKLANCTCCSFLS